ncbi:hypothetical protein SYNTR_1961 [Candidatus Syntrophocurvum alkaliphilum]|uniref:DUF3784 domain-containing protein n=1 Tax=Candidatus Syntrophocurvum alkaliphilum TaxID=2293317 RepID=A0A6I6DD46_9FIRM|nr:hypothetical protein [Candidatus Syntrophocurvum alkaliphilum]QGU00555.1 hypothetical protein SYNTR_1961 [Candidatus Syntrophocurvum alkaliphilum]
MAIISIIISIILIGIGMLLLALGTAVAKYGLVGLVTGLKPVKPEYRILLARWIGITLMIIGTVMVIAFVLNIFLPEISLGDAFLTFIGIAILGIVSIILGKKKYMVQ